MTAKSGQSVHTPSRRSNGRLAFAIAVASLSLGCGARITVDDEKQAAPGALTPTITAPVTNKAGPNPGGVSAVAALKGRLQVSVVERYPHDPTAFTQGLVLTPSGTLFEGTGTKGKSEVRSLDISTGEVRQSEKLGPEFFGEGLALRSDGSLVQLTWQEHTAFVRDQSTLAETGRFTYDTEGWGLCGDGTRLIMSDGTSTLTFRDPSTFQSIGIITVTRDGAPVQMLNELECVEGKVFANVWQTDQIVVINATTGTVDATIEAAGLLTPAERGAADVLNGIAYDARDGTFLLTGKRWPWLFRVRFVPA